MKVPASWDINDEAGQETIRLIEEAGGTGAYHHVDVSQSG